MLIELSEEQSRALHAGRAVPVRDGASTYYVVPGEEFEKIGPLLEVQQVDPSLYEAGEIELFDDQ